jgi:hypothetical protein
VLRDKEVILFCAFFRAPLHILYAYMHIRIYIHIYINAFMIEYVSLS